MAKVKKNPRVSLTIYRISDKFAERSVFRSPEDLQEEGVEIASPRVVGLGERAEVVIKTREPKKPGWASFVSSAVPSIKRLIIEHSTQSVALCVELPKNKCRYVLTFGHGWTLINPEAIERGFGLRCALGLIGDGDMLSVGYKQVDHATMFSNMQANRRVDFSAFQVDTEAAILGGVVGRPTIEVEQYSVVLGSDALHLNPRIDGRPDSLVTFLSWVEEVRVKKAYTRNCEWIDAIRAVTDPAQVDTYVKLVEKDINSDKAADKSRAWFAPPEPIDFATIEQFSIVGSRGKLVEEVTLELVHDVRKKLEVADMKKARLLAHNGDGEEVERWPIFEWLNWTRKVDKQTVILQAGNFYQVDRAFEDRVDKSIKGMSELPGDYPDWKDRKSKQGEDVYNKKLAKAIRGELLDKQRFTKAFRGHGELELCDVLARSGKDTILIFVKKFAGHSAALSHLFAQGLNSVETLLADEVYRAEIGEKKIHNGVADGISQIAAPAPSSLVMAYVILTPEVRRSVVGLPFFSKLTLYRAYRQASSRGIKVLVGTRTMRK